MGSQDLLHGEVLPLPDLPAPFVTPADQGPLLPCLVLSYEGEGFLGELLACRTLSLGMVTSSTKGLLFCQGRCHHPESLCKTDLFSSEPCSGKPGRNLLSLPNRSLFKRPCMMGQRKEGPSHSTVFPPPSQSSPLQEPGKLAYGACPAEETIWRD